MAALKGTGVLEKRNVKILIVVIIAAFTTYMIGCGTDDATVGFQVTPPDGSTITPETPITITFDKTPMNVVSLLLFLDVQFDTKEETLSVVFQTEYSGQYIFTWELAGRDLKIKVESHLDSILRFSEGSLTMWINDIDGENLETYSYTVRSR